MAEKEVLATWPKHKRICNLGLCPAFTLTGEQSQAVLEAGKRLRELGGDIKKTHKEVGDLQGTCLALMQDVKVNSLCKASDPQFIKYIRSLGQTDA